MRFFAECAGVAVLLVISAMLGRSPLRDLLGFGILLVATLCMIWLYDYFRNKFLP